MIVGLGVRVGIILQRGKVFVVIFYVFKVYWDFYVLKVFKDI